MKTFKNPILTKPEAEQALDTAIALVRRNLPLYTDHIIPYQELLGNYDSVFPTMRIYWIIPYQELLGNYDLE